MRSGRSKISDPLRKQVRVVCRLARKVTVRCFAEQRLEICTRMIRSAHGIVSRVTPVHTALRNCTRDDGRPYEFGNQVLISSHRKLLSSKAMVVNVAEKSGHDPVRQG